MAVRGGAKLAGKTVLNAKCRLCVLSPPPELLFPPLWLIPFHQSLHLCLLLLIRSAFNGLVCVCLCVYERRHARTHTHKRLCLSVCLRDRTQLCELMTERLHQTFAQRRPLCRRPRTNNSWSGTHTHAKSTRMHSNKAKITRFYSNPKDKTQCFFHDNHI